MRGKLIVILVIGLAAIVTLAAAPAYIRHIESELREHKSARTTTGVVLDKKHVQFANDQTSYQDEEGRTVHLEGWRKQSGEFRIYYKIDNFDQIPETHRSAVATAEEARSKRFGHRFRIVDQGTFDQAKSGQAVTITYRWADDSKIEIISFSSRL